MDKRNLDRYKRVLLEKRSEISIARAEAESPIPAAGGLGRRSDRPSECGCRSRTSDPLTSNQPAAPPSNRGRARSDQNWHLRHLRGLSKPNLPSTVRSCTLGATLSRLQRPRTWVRREVVELPKSEVSYYKKDRFDRRLFSSFGKMWFRCRNSFGCRLLN